MSDEREFQRFRGSLADFLLTDQQGAALSQAWMNYAQENKYSYQFDWMSRPIIQYPGDIIAMQEVIWRVKPDLIIETGIARGGSLILYASLLALLDMCEALEREVVTDIRRSNRRVIGVDCDIRGHNRAAIESHPMSSRIEMLEGSSVDPKVVTQVEQAANGYSTIMVVLDSNHNHEHVLRELEAYAPLVSVGSYCVVFDTLIEGMPESLFEDRPWGNGNNPRTAVREFCGKNPEFVADRRVDGKLLLTVAPEGFLRRIDV